jgi:hypothetical protein
MPRESKRAPFAIRMQPSVKEAGERAAADANRSLSSLMETLLIEYLKANAYLPSEPGRSVAGKAKKR